MKYLLIPGIAPLTEKLEDSDGTWNQSYGYVQDGNWQHQNLHNFGSRVKFL